MENEIIISPDEIKLILERYRIGKKPLAKLLGWGETTIIRYMEGDIPTNEYSTKLRTILDDPEYYYELLCRKKEYLTAIAFKKSKKAVLSKIMATSIYAVAYYVVNRSGADICAGFIQYILYYTQAFSLALCDREMFQEEYGVGNDQMPYAKIYESMKRCGVHSLEGVEEFLKPEEMELIDAVMDSFLWYGPKALSSMLSSEKSMMKISRDKYNNKIVSKESLKQYFIDILEQYAIRGISDIHKYPDQKIIDIKNISRTA
jgi:hypothetical protein